MGRRYACRFIKITVKDTRRKIKLFNFNFKSSTSADCSSVSFPDISDPLLKRIDKVSVNTLKECMQSFFEDSPKRDRRLWIGDFRLEALTNYFTFKNLEIVRRCLYLFAAGDTNSHGFLPSFVYETPYFYSGKVHIEDYALLWVVAVCDYYKYSQDKETVFELLDICKNQLNSFNNTLDTNGITRKNEGWFAFIDWCKELKPLTALQGVYLYTVDKFVELLKNIDDNDVSLYEKRLIETRKNSYKFLFNSDLGIFSNNYDEGQISIHSQVFMILGGVICGEEAKALLIKTLKMENAVKAFTPYMRHYIIEALIKIGLKDEALDYIKTYWGGMIERNADTFFEVYVPDDHDFSPYNDRKINSLCHAWSCTPAYFIRKYFT